LKITVVGAGTAGVLAAAYLKKKLNADVTLLYSDDIPTIGVGESVTPFVTRFLQDLELDEKEWMTATNSIYKYANCFENWSDTNNKQMFAFTYNEPVEKVIAGKAITWNDMKNLQPTDIRSTDVWVQNKLNNNAGEFSSDFNHLHEFMIQSKAPFVNNKYIGTPYSYAYHIDAEALGKYVKDVVCKKLGVKQIIGSIVKVNGEIDSVELDNGDIIESDYWVDATGFHRALIKNLTNDYVHYDTPANSAWVAPLKYTDKSQLKNYTQSIWNEKGWIFQIGLKNRQGCGLVFDNNFFDVEIAKNEFLKHTGDRCLKEPRLIQWEPKRLKTPAIKNTFAIGMCAGFVEPMEANAIYVTIATIKGVERAISQNDIKEYNKRVTFTLDDIKDFIHVHYTLCPKGLGFWEIQRKKGKDLNHKNLLLEKYNSAKHNIGHAVEYWTMFPDYMWLELASAWEQDITDFAKPVANEIVSSYNNITQTRKHKINSILPTTQNYADFIEEFHSV
jgi:tryptophan halogenase